MSPTKDELYLYWLCHGFSSLKDVGGNTTESTCTSRDIFKWSEYTHLLLALFSPCVVAGLENEMATRRSPNWQTCVSNALRRDHDSLAL